MHARHHRRRRITPIVDRRNDYVWNRALEGMGLQALHSNNKSDVANAETSNAMDMPTPAASSSATKSKKKITILDLPIETQKAIFEHSSPSDLLSLALVSRHFRHIAAAHLYRSFHIVFPNDDDLDFESPSDPLAAGLETFATSDYDYAKYVREIILEPSCGREGAQSAYRDYLADTSCGKFLNTLLVLTLRKTKALETFKWDVRVEPSRQVFKALHDLKALQHLHIRLHAGNSIYNTPPSVPAATASANNSFSPLLQPVHPTFTFPPLNPLPIVHTHPTIHIYSGNSSNQFVAGSNLASKSKYRGFKAGNPTSGRRPPTLSGFKNLTTLAVLDMDSLDYVSEIHQCIVRSWTTLTSLRLSFSEALSGRSRKPPPELHSDDDSDQEDDFTQLAPVPPGVPPPAPPLSSSNDAPTKALKAQEEKKKQEAVLAQILGIDQAMPEPPPPPPPAEPDRRPTEDPRKAFAKNLAPLGKLLLKLTEGEDSDVGKAALSVITNASKLYVDSLEKELSGSETEAGGGLEAPLTTAPDPPSEDAGKTASENDATERGLFDEPEKKKRPQINADVDISNPDDIDVEAPEAPETASDNESATPEDEQHIDDATRDGEAKNVAETKAALSNELNELLSGPRTTESKFYKYYLKERTRLQQLIEDHLDKRDSITVTDAVDEAKKETLRESIDALIGDLIELELEFKVKLGDSRTSPTTDGAVDQVSEYVRQTRGLNLDTLAIYLIPIKAVVVMRAINIHVLRSITLLEVGHQSLFWVSAAKANRVSPLPLRNIYTDNITLHFLALVHQLKCVEELLMVERKQHALIESATPKTIVTIDQIRRTALKKHARTLKVLMIQNDDTPDWDLNTESAILLCQRAKNLEELAVSFGTRTMHTLLQFLPGLTSLRALHTLQFRHDDTCVWVMREFRKFAVDTISHNPDMKLEYLALGEAVERLVRQKPRKVDKKGKGKAKQGGGGRKNVADMFSPKKPSDSPTQSAVALQKIGMVPAPPIFWDDSDDDDLRVGGKNGLLVETVEGVEFSDIPEVRIFEKDVLCGRL